MAFRQEQKQSSAALSVEDVNTTVRLSGKQTPKNIIGVVIDGLISCIGIIVAGKSSTGEHRLSVTHYFTDIDLIRLAREESDFIPNDRQVFVVFSNCNLREKGAFDMTHLRRLEKIYQAFKLPLPQAMQDYCKFNNNGHFLIRRVVRKGQNFTLRNIEDQEMQPSSRAQQECKVEHHPNPILPSFKLIESHLQDPMDDYRDRPHRVIFPTRTILADGDCHDGRYWSELNCHQVDTRLLEFLRRYAKEYHAINGEHHERYPVHLYAQRFAHLNNVNFRVSEEGRHLLKEFIELMAFNKACESYELHPDFLVSHDEVKEADCSYQGEGYDYCNFAQYYDNHSISLNFANICQNPLWILTLSPREVLDELWQMNNASGGENTSLVLSLLDGYKQFFEGLEHIRRELLSKHDGDLDTFLIENNRYLFKFYCDMRQLGYEPPRFSNDTNDDEEAFDTDMTLVVQSKNQKRNASAMTENASARSAKRRKPGSEPASEALPNRGLPAIASGQSGSRFFCNSEAKAEDGKMVSQTRSFQFSIGK